MRILSVLMASDNKISFLLFLLQRSIKRNKNRLKVAKIISLFSPTVLFKKSHSRYQFLKDDECRSYAMTLKTEGLVQFPGVFFLEDEILNIINKLKGLKLSDPYGSQNNYSETNLPDDVNCSHYRRTDLCKISEIINLANDEGILELAKSYLGATPTISNINCWWGTHGTNSPRDNELFHRDKDDYDFVKFFIYLTDTDEDDYNIVYVKNTLNSSKALDKLRYSESEVIELFGTENITHATGGKGTGFMAANYGIHNGTLPKIKGRRTLLLQIEYSVRGIAYERYQPIKIEEIVGKISNTLDPWVNRLLIQV